MIAQQFQRTIDHPTYKTPHYDPKIPNDVKQTWQFYIIDAVTAIWEETRESASLEEIHAWLVKNQKRLGLSSIPDRRTGINLDRRVNEAASINPLENFSMKDGKPQLRGIGKVPDLPGNSRYMLNPDCHPEVQVVGGA